MCRSKLVWGFFWLFHGCCCCFGFFVFLFWFGAFFGFLVWVFWCFVRVFGVFLFFFFSVNLLTKIQIFKPSHAVVTHNPPLPAWVLGTHCRCKPWAAEVLLAHPHPTPTQPRECSSPELGTLVLPFPSPFGGVNDKIECGVCQRRVAQQWQEVVELFMGNKLAMSRAPSWPRGVLWGVSELLEPRAAPVTSQTCAEGKLVPETAPQLVGAH